ncbi:hypothetical protein [Vibrio sp. SCSIO 43137]|uniref:hypothetical protein n=1 Tax=Vibrio sp. SCSIO 43137 TaxID=3021011 RepID=UPI002307AC83|nr:hypothetical protein [Vibrio sp. SCSIO 43137]WCE28412.1 hypothetical protein PK654_08470 [Vibrio sp. SCSIO 43137]
MDKMLAVELLERVRSGVATSAELAQARAYLNDNRHLIGYAPEHPAHGFEETLPDVSSLPDSSFRH